MVLGVHKKKPCLVNEKQRIRYNPFSYAAFFVLLVMLFTLRSVRAQDGDVTYVHDPCIIKSDGYYYIYSTGDKINMRRTKDLLHNWQYLGLAFDSIPGWGVQEVPGVTDIWAPDIIYKDSTYYLYYSLSTFGSQRSRIGLAANRTLDPQNSEYHWDDLGEVIGSEPGEVDFNAIDPNAIKDVYGRYWLAFGSFWNGIKLIELDPQTMKPKTDATLHSLASRSDGAIEASYIVYKNGLYYLFVSFDHCCNGIYSDYKVMVGRSYLITGPYNDKSGKPMMEGGGTLVYAGDERWRGPGHCAVLLDEEADWLVYHAYDAENEGIPTLRISRLGWDMAGWPYIDSTTTINLQTPVYRPGGVTLHQNYPNPFNPITVISYQLPSVSNVELTVYNTLGEKVKTLVNGRQPAGDYHISFDASGLASGVYVYKLKAGMFTQTRTMIFVE